jgi:hypothetical protein
MTDQPTAGDMSLEYSSLARKQRRTLQLVVANFAMFLILFATLIYVAWQSSVLISRLQDNITRAEQAVANIQARISESPRESLAAVLANSPALARVSQISERVDELGITITHTAEAVQAVSEKIVSLDSGEIADQVSYRLLQSVGDGFSRAAEARKPRPM